MDEHLSTLKVKVEDTREWLVKAFSSVRTGRATSAILDSIMVDSYGSKVPINQIANIGTEDARTLRIVPWSPDQIVAIEGAINTSNLGLSVSSDGKGIRIIFPELTSETREALLKLAKSKLEEAKIAIRNKRDEVWGEIQKKEREGDVSEDDKFKFKDDIQKVVDEANKGLDEMYSKKETEIKI